MTEQNRLDSFDDLCELLLPLGALNGPAELHGMLCGKLCGGVRLDTDAWLSAAWAFLDLDGAPAGAASMAIKQLYDRTLRQLEAGDFAVELLLPDDDSDLGQRSLALGQWCHGFLSGFGSAGIDGDRKLSVNAADALRDFAAIVQIGTEDDDEEAEAHYMEVVEYVRMAALTLFMEFGSANGSRARTPATLH